MKIFKHLKSEWFKYGFESLAIVVGILAAFALDNWNEERKEKQFEQEILSDINTSIEANIWQLNTSINCNKKAIKSCHYILDQLNSSLPYHDSLDAYFSRAIQWCTPSLKNAGYESLKTYGRKIISNDTIREALNIFDAGWIETLNKRQEDYFFYTASPILTGLFETVAMRSNMKPFNYEELKASNKFRSILHTSIANREDQINWYGHWLADLKELSRSIDNEIAK